MANKESTCAYSIDSAYKNRFVEDINLSLDMHSFGLSFPQRFNYFLGKTYYIYTKHLVNITRFVKGRYMIIDVILNNI